MMKKIKELGHKCCIVTNCNRTVANEIVNKIGIVSYIDFIICGSECTNGKPAPDPYLTAMKQYNIKKIPTIIGIQNNQVTYYDANDKNDSLKGFIALQIGPPPPPERLGQNHQRTIRNKNII